MKLKHTLLMLALSAGASQAANTIYRNAVLADNPIAYWEFDETSGTTAADSSGNGKDATFTGSYALSSTSGAANLGTSVSLDGGHIIAAADLGGSHSQISIEAWLNLDTVPAETEFAAIIAGDWEAGVGHLNVYGDKFKAATFLGTDTESAPGLTAATWYHVVMTLDGAGGLGSHNIYVNGALSGSGAVINNSDTFNVDNALIGAWANNFTPVPYTIDRIIDGKMDEFAIYDSVLTATQVSNHFVAASVPEPTSAALLGLGGLALILRRRK